MNKIKNDSAGRREDESEVPYWLDRVPYRVHDWKTKCFIHSIYTESDKNESNVETWRESCGKEAALFVYSLVLIDAFKTS